MLLRSFWHSPSPTSDLMRAAVLLKYWGYVLDDHDLVIDGNNRHLPASLAVLEGQGASWDQARSARRERPARHAPIDSDSSRNILFSGRG
jgi:hypothetical protein